ncbi:MAG: glutamate synthase domain-containing protein 2 [Crocinitomicaceae bacterium]|jgi:glutamate synthase domain-containing protein 2
MKARGIFIVISIIILSAIGVASIFWLPILWSLIVIGPLIIMGVLDITQKKHGIKRNFPVIGRARYMLEKIRPEIMQYFVETDTEGAPINRMFRTLQCNSNSCPVGVSTQNKELMKGLDVDDKARTVANFHRETLGSFSEMIAAAGIDHPSKLERKHINRRVSMHTVLKYNEIFPYEKQGRLIEL